MKKQEQKKVQNNEVTDTTAELTEKIEELTNDLQRTRADFENFRKQVELQKMQAINNSALVTVEKFLPLLDDFERAFEVYPEQLTPLQKNFQKTLQELKLAQIDSKLETPFNPEIHNAVMVEDGEGEQEVVAETLRPGYLYNGEVLRPAMVKVKRIN